MSKKMCNFAPVMEKILRVHHVHDYARYIGAPELHPLVSVIHYDELEHCHHSLNNYDVYGMFIGDEELEDLSYGQLQYVLKRHALMCVSLGFDYPQHFTRTFKRHFGLSPSEYLKKR